MDAFHFEVARRAQGGGDSPGNLAGTRLALCRGMKRIIWVCALASLWLAACGGEDGGGDGTAGTEGAAVACSKSDGCTEYHSASGDPNGVLSNSCTQAGGSVSSACTGFPLAGCCTPKGGGGKVCYFGSFETAKPVLEQSCTNAGGTWE